MVAGHLHAAIRPEASALGTSFWRRYILTEIYPAITTKVEFEELKNSIAIPSSIPFTAIYVAGDFGYGRDGPGGYFCWRVDERQG
jgi:hypothetical protein